MTVGGHLNRVEEHFARRATPGWIHRRRGPLQGERCWDLYYTSPAALSCACLTPMGSADFQRPRNPLGEYRPRASLLRLRRSQDRTAPSHYNGVHTSSVLNQLTHPQQWPATPRHAHTRHQSRPTPPHRGSVRGRRAPAASAPVRPCGRRTPPPSLGRR